MASNMSGPATKLVYRVSVDPQTGWGDVQIVGDILVGDLPRMMAEIWSHPQYELCSAAIWDLSESRTRYYLEDVTGLVEYVKKNKGNRGATVVALVAPRDIEYGTSRMFAMLGEQAGYTIGVFRSRATAEAWLREQGSTD